MRTGQQPSSARRCRRAIVGATLVASTTLAAGCGDKAPAASAATRPAEAVEVAVVSARPATIDQTVDVVGTLFGEQESSIASKSTGRIVELYADLGDRLDDGAKLAQVDPTDATLEVQRRELALSEALAKLGLEQLPASDFDVGQIATVRRADVQAKNAQSRLDRARQLFEQKPPLLSEQDFADTQTQFEVAKQDLDVARLEAGASLAAVRSRKAELDEARQMLADTTLRAPAGPAKGRWGVVERRVAIGDFVQPATVAFRLVSDVPVRLRAAVPERFAAQVKLGQPVSLAVDALPAPVAGKVTRISPAIEPASRTFAVEATFDNADRKLNAGSFARATIVVGQRSDVLRVPAAALYSFAGLDKVFVVDNGEVRAKDVQILRRDAGEVLIADTIGPTRALAGSALARLATGVKVREAATTQPAAAARPAK